MSSKLEKKTKTNLKPRKKFVSNLPPGPGPGRKKGVPNKINNDIRQFVIETAQKFNDDPDKAIHTVDKNLFWGTIFPKIIPKDINVQAQLWTRQLSDEELTNRIKQILTEMDDAIIKP
jgi:hypothetical protein